MKKTISFNTKFGWISGMEENGKITEIKFLKTKNFGKSLILKRLKKMITGYFSKQKTSFNLPLEINGSLLQKKIWKELKKIRFGKTKTYGEIAKKYKLSPRYIGKICGQNKIVLVIPCHRVIRSDNTLGGFSSPGGIKLKKKLLDFEKN